MGQDWEKLAAFVQSQGAVIRICLTGVYGSSPRNTGTEMFASQTGLFGTIGGGQLEYLAIERARAMINDGMLNAAMDVPLGPEIGQCCGGRVKIALSRMRASDRRDAIGRAQIHDNAQPHVFIMGAGHVGRALAAQFQHLPVRCILVDPRPEEVALCETAVETRVSAIPEVDIMTAPSGSAFIVLTHDHGLDFLLASAALERKDASYVGMIGSATKRAKFRNWMLKQNERHLLEHLNCPIGASGSRDKRPSIIASFVVAEVMAELTSETAATTPEKAIETPALGNDTDRRGVLA